MIRLAHGVVAGRGHGVWAPGPDGVPVVAATAGLEAGAAVVVGPERSDEVAVRRAVDDLTALVTAGGLAVAGAGVEVGAGFWTARLAGVRGDRRDAVLAALRLLGIDGVERLGNRAGVLVALFGPAATKPVAAKARDAIRDGRWAALHLASAASGVLGPEQLERILDLVGPAGVDTDQQGMASVLAGNLEQIFGAVSTPRRLALLLDLWLVVCAQHARAERLGRLRAVQARHDRLPDVLERHHNFVDQQVVAQIQAQIGRPPTLAEAARWFPMPWHWKSWLNWAMHDALGATVLLRTAVAVADHGLTEGIARCRTQIAAAPFLLSSEATSRAKKQVTGLAGLPARPGCLVRDLDSRLKPGAPIAPATEAFVRHRLSRAREYGLVARRAVHDLLDALESAGLAPSTISSDCGHLRQWRAAAGYSPVRPPSEWDQPPLWGEKGPLAHRLRAEPDAQPAVVETPGDLLWYADLADALAQLNGHDAATITYGPVEPTADVDPVPPEPEPLRPSPESVALAVAGAAQLVGLGAEVNRRARSWAEFVDALLAATVVAEALTGSFPIPGPLAGVDATTVPGTDARVEIAHDPHKLAEWARYMGNCIAGPYYLQAALRGECVLAALRDPTGQILANVELIPHRTGWRIDELRGRFNADPDPVLAARLRDWVHALAPARTRPTPPPRHSAPRPIPHPRGTNHHRRRVQHLQEVGQSLNELAAQALETTELAGALEVLRGVPGLPGATALRRASPGHLRQAVGRGVAGGAPDLATLWHATAIRPLAEALANLDPMLRQRFGYLGLLLTDAPLPAAPRRLARLPAVAQARSVDLVARRVRRAIGRMARADDPILARAVPPHADTAMLCALVLAVSTATRVPAHTLTPLTTRGTLAVPGHPASTLDDDNGPWQRAWPVAVELGADADWTGRHPPIVVPTSWLGPGGWAALWARAARKPVS